MIKILQLVKTLNNTEAGRTKTNDSYLRMSYGVDIDNFFDNVTSKKYSFCNKKNNNSFEVRVERSHDGIRIYNMGKITNSKSDDLWAGDKVILEKRIINNKVDYFIDCEKKIDTVIFQSFKNKYFELLTPQTFYLLDDCKNIRIENVGKDKKRKDSDEVDIYNIFFNNKRISAELTYTELLKITKIKKDCYVSKTKSWEFYEYEFEE